MKTTIQIYGFVIIFCVLLFLIPQVCSFALIYRQCNSVASYIVEIIEVNEGVDINGNTMDRINSYMEKYPKMKVDISKQEISEDFNTYKVRCYTDTTISILSLKYEISSSKNTRRVIH